MTPLRSSSTISLLAHAPRFSAQEAASIADELYGIRVIASPLPSERDQNFLLTSNADEQFVLRIANGLEDPALLEAQNEVLNNLNGRFPFCQRLLASKQGRYLEKLSSTSGGKNLVRLNTYLRGVPLAEIGERSPKLLKDLGLKLGMLDETLLEFDHPAIHRNFHWDLANWQAVLGTYVKFVRDERLRIAISHYEREFEGRVAPLLPHVRRSCIHGDANDYNILTDPDSSAVTGFIDFGDIVYSYTVGDLAIALAYVVLNDDPSLNSAMHVVSGYQEILPLEKKEIEALWGLVLMRLCMSICLAAYQQLEQPNNEYLEISQQAIRTSLPGLLAIDSNKAAAAFLGVA